MLFCNLVPAMRAIERKTIPFHNTKSLLERIKLKMYLCFFRIQSMSNSFYYLTETLQVFGHVFNSLPLLFRKQLLHALVQYNFLQQALLAQLTNEFDVSQHLMFCNPTLFLLLCGKGAIFFVKGYNNN